MVHTFVFFCSMTHVVNTEVIEGPGDLDLLLGVEESVGELLTLTQSRLNDLETRDIAQEIGDADVVAVGVAGGGGVGVLASLNSSETFVVWRDVSQSLIDDCSPTYFRHWLAHWARGRHRGTLCSGMCGVVGRVIDTN